MAHSTVAAANLCFGVLNILGAIFGPSTVPRTIYGVIGVVNILMWWVYR